MALKLGELCQNDELSDQPMRRLLLAKQAIVQVTRKLQLEMKEAQAESTDDKLGCTMRFIRAAEELRMGTMRKCISAYPYLRTLADPENPNTRINDGLRPVREHAIELTREGILNDIRELHARSNDLDEIQRNVRRDNI